MLICTNPWLDFLAHLCHYLNIAKQFLEVRRVRADGQVVEDIVLHRPQVGIHVGASALLALLHLVTGLSLGFVYGLVRHLDLVKVSDCDFLRRC